MKIWIILTITVAFFLVGCAGDVRPAYTNYNYQSESTSQDMKFDNVDIVGWMDDPSAVFVLDSKTKNSKSRQRVQRKQIEYTPKVQKRKVYYNGYIKQKSPTPSKVLDSAESYVKSIQGYTESRTSNTLVLRVPVKEFEPVFDSLKTFAKLLSKSITASDITNSFNDTELRIKIAKARIEKLKQLIAKSENDKEKLRLLKRLQEVSEELQKLDGDMQVLVSLANYSRITFTVIDHDPNESRYQMTEIGAFTWIAKLDPFSKYQLNNHQKSNVFSYPKVSFNTPSGFVFLEKNRYWHVTSSKGSEIWTRVLENDPKGNTQFWIDAIKSKIGPQFKNQSEVLVGEFKFVRVEAFGSDPYIYYVGVSADGDDLKIVEMYFPNVAQEKLHLENIKSVIKAGEK
jgi:hypothetical protein